MEQARCGREEREGFRIHLFSLFHRVLLLEMYEVYNGKI